MFWSDGLDRFGVLWKFLDDFTRIVGGRGVGDGGDRLVKVECMGLE